MAKEDDLTTWELLAVRTIKEFVREDSNFAQVARIAEREFGEKYTRHTLTKRINGGKFPFWFLLMCLHATGRLHSRGPYKLSLVNLSEEDKRKIRQEAAARPTKGFPDAVRSNEKSQMSRKNKKSST